MRISAWWNHVSMQLLNNKSFIYICWIDNNGVEVLFRIYYIGWYLDAVQIYLGCLIDTKVDQNCLKYTITVKKTIICSVGKLIHW